jgi:UDP-N-acetylmuramate--alanine ligase
MSTAPLRLDGPPVRVHVVGIGGAGMSAIAAVLATMGHRVTGSDVKETPVVDRLRRAGIKVAVGHDAAHVADCDVVTASTAVPPTNPEVAEARRRGVPVLHRADMLAAIATQRRCVAVSGTHGKTTTASMVALALVEAGLRPSFLIGGDVNEIGTNAVWDAGEWLVVEADESDGSFLSLRPEVAVVTNVEADHLDHYGSFDALREAFATFLSGAARTVVGGDDPVAAQLGRDVGAVLVGTAETCDYVVSRVHSGRSSIAFELVGPAAAAAVPVDLAVPGLHNARNAAVAVLAAVATGVPMADATHALARFAGVARRFEFRGEAHGVTFVDDYAHLPTEVEAALAAAADGGWRRVVAVFQPHRYSRTKALWQAFGPAFRRADVVVVTDVFGAGEAPVPGVTGRLVAEAVREASPGTPVVFVAERSELRRTVAELLEAGDLCCTLGAGDLTSLPDELLEDPTW